MRSIPILYRHYPQTLLLALGNPNLTVSLKQSFAQLVDMHSGLAEISYAYDRSPNSCPAEPLLRISQCNDARAEGTSVYKTARQGHARLLIRTG